MTETRQPHFYANIPRKPDQSVPPQYVDTIQCADSLSWLANLPDNCIDLVFTSPPYNFGQAYDSHNDETDWKGYLKSLYEVMEECIRVTKYGGRIIINVQPLYSDYVPSHHFISNYLIQQGLIWKGEILWEKNNYNCKYTAWGSWKSPSSPYLKYTWEFIEVFCKGALKHEGNPADSDMTADEFKSWTTAKWSVAPERKMKQYGHPAMFPEEIARRVLKLFSFQHDTILDPFNGAGTTSLVAKQTGRHYIGVDISESYCQIARTRINTCTKS